MIPFNNAITTLVHAQIRGYLQQPHTFQTLKTHCLDNTPLPEIIGAIETILTQEAELKYQSFCTEKTTQAFEQQIIQDEREAIFDAAESTEDIQLSNTLREKLIALDNDIKSIRTSLDSTREEKATFDRAITALGEQIREKKTRYYGLITETIDAELRRIELTRSVIHGHALRHNLTVPVAVGHNQQTHPSETPNHPHVSLEKQRRLHDLQATLLRKRQQVEQLQSSRFPTFEPIEEALFIMHQSVLITDIQNAITAHRTWIQEPDRANEKLLDLRHCIADIKNTITAYQTRIQERDHVNKKLLDLQRRIDKLTQETHSANELLTRELPEKQTRRELRSQARAQRSRMRESDNRSLSQLSEANQRQLNATLAQERQTIDADKKTTLEQARLLIHPTYIDQLIDCYPSLPNIQEADQHNLYRIAMLMKQLNDNKKQQQCTQKTLTKTTSQLVATQQQLRNKKQQLLSHETSVPAIKNTIAANNTLSEQIRDRIQQRQNKIKRTLIVGGIFLALALVAAPLLAVATSMWMVPTAVITLVSLTALITALCLKIQSSNEKKELHTLQESTQDAEKQLKRTQDNSTTLKETQIPNLMANEKQLLAQVEELKTTLATLATTARDYYSAASAITELRPVAPPAYGNIVMFASPSVPKQAPTATNPTAEPGLMDEPAIM